MSQAREAYETLIKTCKETALLESCSLLLQWDQETYMPPGATAHRAGQLALLAKMVHDRFTAPQVGELLEECESSGLAADPRRAEAVNLREIRRTYDKKTKLPRRLVEELAHLSVMAHSAWVQARKSSDFEVFRPWLEKIIVLKKEQAAALGYVSSPYDALLDDFEPGETEAHLEQLFSKLQQGLVPLTQKILGSARQPMTSFLRRHYPLDRQRLFGEIVASAIGFNFNSGRLDEVVHPFCMLIGPGDTRITSSYSSDNFSKGFFGILHESGHGLYDQGLDPQHFGTPMGEPASLAIHESQSLIWENFIGRGRPFWEYFFLEAKGTFREALKNVSLDRFLAAVNRVRPSFIRIEADEITYNLHVILRFELEKALIAGDLAPSEVPGAWNERFKELMGIEVPDNRRGCLQDTHWAQGLFGYFPTYCLGYLYAAQFFAKARAEIPDLDNLLSGGRFDVFLSWLRKNIHSQGMRYRAGDLVEKVTGEPLSTEPFITYLWSKYGQLYGF